MLSVSTMSFSMRLGLQHGHRLKAIALDPAPRRWDRVAIHGDWGMWLMDFDRFITFL